MAQPVPIPDLAALPGDAYLTRRQVAAVANVSIPALKIWPEQGRGPRLTRIEGMPRYRVADVRAWLASGTAEPAAA